jgi:hypothetical protein
MLICTALDAVQQFLCATTDRLRLEDLEVVGWEIQRPFYRVLGKGRFIAEKPCNSSSSCRYQGRTTGTLHIANGDNKIQFYEPSSMDSMKISN